MVNPARTRKTEKPYLAPEYLAHVGEGDPLHIARARKEAITAYLSSTLPTRVGHVWKHASPGAFIPSLLELPPGNRFMESHDVGKETEIQYLVGSDLFVTLSEEAAKKGVHVCDLRDAAAHIGTIIPAQRGFFESMNQAAWSSGIYIRVPTGVRLTTPIHLHTSTDARFPFVRTYIQLEAGASATLVERISSSAFHGPSVLVSEVDVADNAALHHAFIYRQDAEDTLHASHSCRLGEGSTLQLMATTVGTGRLKADFAGLLCGRHAHSDIRTFALLQGNTQIELHTSQHHQAPKSTSDMKSRSVLLDRSVSSNTGLIRIEEAAKDCEAYQIARNIILSKDAQATAIPELEIENNDVICSHGAATGTIDSTQLFYLTSRGLSPSEATQLIVEGTLNEILDSLPEILKTPIAEAHGPVWAQLKKRTM